MQIVIQPTQRELGAKMSWSDDADYLESYVIVSSSHVYPPHSRKEINRLPWSRFLTDCMPVFISQLVFSITKRVSYNPAAQTKEIIIL